MTTYRCIEGHVTAGEHDDDLGLTCAAEFCGALLYPSDAVVSAKPAPTGRALAASRLKFRLSGSASDYLPGEMRRYDVVYDGSTIGVCDADYLPHPTIEGEVVRGFSYTDRKGRRGDGLTRTAAVLDAYMDRP